MSAMFRIGQRVVCVDADCISIAKPLVEQKTYVIRAVHEGVLPADLGTFGFLLEGVCNPINRLSGREIGYRSDRFRPLTDISVFERLLTSTPSDLPADPAEPKLPAVPVLHGGG